ncbi:hypothetical protein [Streptomyces mirabilis]|uniref:hypothetical protein n=1 Tax=Streptomyces mirabilis TaxID=68239 RepID=UPI0036AFF9C6
MKSEEVTAVGAPIRSHISDYAETGPAEPSAEADSSALAKPPVRPDAEGRQAPKPGVPAYHTPAHIPALPKLGTTWYERGVRYWLRRASGAVL